MNLKQLSFPHVVASKQNAILDSIWTNLFKRSDWTPRQQVWFFSPSQNFKGIVSLAAAPKIAFSISNFRMYSVFIKRITG